MFSCEYCEMFNATYFEKYQRTAAFDCFSGSLLHRSKGSRSKLYDGFTIQGPSHRPSFLFLSRHISLLTESRPVLENLGRIRLMSQLSFYIGYLFLIILDGCRSFTSFLDRFSSFLTLVNTEILNIVRNINYD